MLQLQSFRLAQVSDSYEYDRSRMAVVPLCLLRSKYFKERRFAIVNVFVAVLCISGMLFTCCVFVRRLLSVRHQSW